MTRSKNMTDNIPQKVYRNEYCSLGSKGRFSQEKLFMVMLLSSAGAGCYQANSTFIYIVYHVV